jgi:hypothetical protein
MNEAELAACGFNVSGCQRVGVLELIEATFDHVAKGVDGAIYVRWLRLVGMIATPRRFSISARIKSTSYSISASSTLGAGRKAFMIGK